MTRVRSQIHMLTVAAARLEQDHANPKLIEDLRKAAKDLAERKAEGRAWNTEEDKRVDRQRTLFNALRISPEKVALQTAMMQRAYDLLWDGDASGCDALIEFLPSMAAEELLQAWQDDQEKIGKAPRSRWYGAESAA